MNSITLDSLKKTITRSDCLSIADIAEYNVERSLSESSIHFSWAFLGPEGFVIRNISEQLLEILYSALCIA